MRANFTNSEARILKALMENPQGLDPRELVHASGIKNVNNLKVMISKLRKKGVSITSPRLKHPNAPRANVKQLYKLEAEA